jgi:hypothetical protein
MILTASPQRELCIQCHSSEGPSLHAGGAAPRPGAGDRPRPCAGAPARAADAPPTRAPQYLKPVAIFNQHLYEGEFGEPRGIAFDRAHGEVWVADSRNGIFGAFTPDGIPLFATPPSEHVHDPVRVAVDAQGRLLVLDMDRSRIKVLSYRGEYVRDLVLPGLPEHPVIGAIAFDPSGQLLVGENATGQVLAYTYEAEPRLKLRFGSNGSEEGQFQSIGGIAADKEFFYVVDHQVTAVQVWGRSSTGSAVSAPARARSRSPPTWRWTPPTASTSWRRATRA